MLVLEVGSSVFEEVSQKRLLFEVWICICGGSLAENVRFGIGMLPQPPLQECFRGFFMSCRPPKENSTSSHELYLERRHRANTESAQAHSRHEGSVCFSEAAQTTCDTRTSGGSTEAAPVSQIVGSTFHTPSLGLWDAHAGKTELSPLCEKAC